MPPEIISAYTKASHFVPNGSRVLLFGSAIDTSNTNDIDVVIIYDNKSIDPREAFKAHDRFIEELGKAISRPVHVMMLNENEYNQSNIKSTEKVVELVVDDHGFYSYEQQS